jgi:hypothetical protein
MTCIIPSNIKDNKKKDFEWKDMAIKGIVTNLDPADKDTAIKIPFDLKNKAMKSQITYQLSEIRKFFPEETYVPFPDFCLTPNSVLEIKSFNPPLDAVQPGDVLVVTDLMASISFTQEPRQDSKDGEELGRIRPVNLPVINFKGNVTKRNTLSAADFKKLITVLPLNAEQRNDNRFLDDDGYIVFPEDCACFPNPSPMCQMPVPLFTRLTPTDLYDLWRAVFNPRVDGFGLIRNRLGLYDSPPKEELEPRGGLPLFTLLNIPKVLEKEKNYHNLLYRKEKDGPFWKCARGGEKTSNLIFAKQQNEDQLGLFYANQSILLIGFSMFESRVDKEVPSYVDGIGIVSESAWEKYAPGLFRALEATIYIKTDPVKSRELTSNILSDRELDEREQQLAPCTHGIRGTTVVAPMMYKTLLGAGLRVSADVALNIILEAQKNDTSRKFIPGMLRSRYKLEDPYCTALIENRNSVRHFLVNAFEGDMTDLPTADDPQWDYFLVPAESTLHHLYEPHDLRNDLLLLRAQSYWLRNHAEDWREENDALAQKWCATKDVVNEMGVFCARKEKA